MHPPPDDAFDVVNLRDDVTHLLGATGDDA